jgi:hypothetical protein
MKVQTEGEFVWEQRQGGNLPKLCVAEIADAPSKLRPTSIVCVGDTLEVTGDADTTAHIARAYETSLLRVAQMLH